MPRLVLCLLIALLPAWPALAQTTVLNPTRVEFEPSPDHGATLPDGSPTLTRYELRIYASGAAQPLSVHDLGKPAPVNNLISTTPTALVGVPVGQVFTVRVAAIGPSGESQSEPSNPFGRGSAPRAPLKVTLR